MVPASQLAGWIGAVVILVAYYCVTNDVWKARSYRYQFTNVIGSAGIATSAWATHSLPSLGLNIIWMLIGCLAMRKQFSLDRAEAKKD
jgi:hypothetical protein